MTSVTVPEVFARLALAFVLGGVIGLERERHDKPAGLRTNILIGLSSALFSVMSMAIGTTGVGARAILRSGNNVHSLTSAATIWVNAAIGMATGAGAYGVAIDSAAIALVVLVLLPVMERLVEQRRGAY